MSSRDVISDSAWSVIGPLLPAWKGVGRPVADRRLIVEGTAWKFRTGAPWRDVPERFGPWNTVFKNFNRWAKDGYFSLSLHVYGRQGKPCDRCGASIVRESFMNRGSHFCPRCQRVRIE